MLLVKKITAYETACVITVPIFWNINTQAMSRLVPVCQSYKVLSRTPHSRSCTWFDPAPKTPGDSQASTCDPCFHRLPSVPEHHCFFWLWNWPFFTTVPKLHEHKTVFCSSTSLLMLGGRVGGHRQGIALLCYLANNSKSSRSLSQQGFSPLFFSSLSYRCCKVFFFIPRAISNFRFSPLFAHLLNWGEH